MDGTDGQGVRMGGELAMGLMEAAAVIMALPPSPPFPLPALPRSTGGRSNLMMGAKFGSRLSSIRNVLSVFHAGTRLTKASNVLFSFNTL